MVSCTGILPGPETLGLLKRSPTARKTRHVRKAGFRFNPTLPIIPEGKSMEDYSDNDSLSSESPTDVFGILDFDSKAHHLNDLNAKIDQLVQYVFDPMSQGRIAYMLFDTGLKMTPPFTKEELLVRALCQSEFLGSSEFSGKMTKVLASLQPSASLRFSCPQPDKSQKAQKGPKSSAWNDFMGDVEDSGFVDHIKYPALEFEDKVYSMDDLDRSLHKGDDLDKSLHKGDDLDRSPYNGADLDKSLHKGDELDRSLHKGADLDRSLHKGDDLDRSLHKGADLNRSPYNGDDLDRSLHKGADLDRSLHKGDELDRSLHKGDDLDRSLHKGDDLDQTRIRGSPISSPKTPKTPYVDFTSDPLEKSRKKIIHEDDLDDFKFQIDYPSTHDYTSTRRPRSGAIVEFDIPKYFSGSSSSETDNELDKPIRRFRSRPSEGSAGHAQGVSPKDHKNFDFTFQRMTPVFKPEARQNTFHSHPSINGI